MEISHRCTLMNTDTVKMSRMSSVLICVHLWLTCLVPAAGRAGYFECFVVVFWMTTKHTKYKNATDGNDRQCRFIRFCRNRLSRLRWAVRDFVRGAI